MLSEEKLSPTSDLTLMRSEFERCWPWLWESLCEFGPTHNKEHVWLRLSSRNSFLWPAEKCVIVGEFINWPIGLRDFNYWLQGGDLEQLLTLHPGIEAWAKSKGRQRATGYGRKGWARVMHGNWENGLTARVKWLNGSKPT